MGCRAAMESITYRSLWWGAITVSLRVTRGRGAALPRRSYDDVLADICARYQVSEKHLLSQDRSRWIAWPRQALMSALYENGWSLPQIGRKLGRRDHTTVLYGVRAHRQREAA